MPRHPNPSHSTLKQQLTSKLYHDSTEDTGLRLWALIGGGNCRRTANPWEPAAFIANPWKPAAYIANPWEPAAYIANPWEPAAYVQPIMDLANFSIVGDNLAFQTYMYVVLYSNNIT